MSRLYTYLILFWLLLSPLMGRAQIVKDLNPTWNQITLMGWFQDTQDYIFNSYQNSNGLMPERGVFNRVTSAMDDEFDLDILNFQFNMNDDYLWYRNPNGFRTYMGHVNDFYLTQFSEIKSTVNFAKKHRLKFYVQSQESFRTNRSFANVEYQFNPNEMFSMGINHNISDFKADLDVGVFFQYGNYQKGFFRFDYKMLDYLNNSGFKSFQEPVAYVDTLRRYIKVPHHFSLYGSTPQIGRLRAEVYFSATTESEAEGADNNAPLQTNFTYLNSNFVFGALLEAQFTFFSSGLFYNREYSFAQWSSIPGSVENVDYLSEQIRTQVGLVLMGMARDFRWDTKIIRESYSDLNDGRDFQDAKSINQAFNFEGIRVMMLTNLRYQPQLRGPVLGVNHSMDIRQFSEDVDVLSSFSESFYDANSRFGTYTGWQFNPRMLIMVGMQFDLDQDVHRIPEGEMLDGAYVKMEIRW